MLELAIGPIIPDGHCTATAIFRVKNSTMVNQNQDHAMVIIGWQILWQLYL